jgi:Kef-type K+ transport system membrane component KefB
MAMNDAGMTSDARTAKRAAMRRATLQLVLGVVVLDAVALLVYYLAIAHAPQRTRMLFVGVWTVATAVLVVVLLKRVRKARFGPMIR